MKKMRRNGGFTLLEVVIAMAILGIVLAMVYMSLFSSSSEYEANAKRAWILHTARLAMDEMAEEIRQSNRFALVGVPPSGMLGKESLPSSTMSFKKVLPPKADGTPQYTANYITYRLDASDNTATVMDTVNIKGPFNLPGAVKVDGRNNGDKGPAGTPDEGRIVRIDPNPDLQGKVYAARIMCNYVKMPDSTVIPPIPAGFQVTQTQIAVPNSQPQTMVRITMTLVFTDSRNKVLEETLETKIYLRNSQ
jgi:prepilin-type N-terminal cleavage/methylation domain-containing protein